MELKLIAHRTDTRFKREIALGQSDVKIGRNPDCQMSLPCDQKIVSRVHAIVRYDNGNYLLEDAGSANGIYLVSKGSNLSPRQQHLLKPGELFNIGPFQLQVSADVSIPPQKPQLKKATREVLADPVRKPAQPGNSETTVFTASGSDHFTPPAALIPENWDLPAEAVSAPVDEPTRKADQQRRADVLSFNQQQHKLVASLLKGMRIGDQLQAADVNADQLEVIGQTLRVLADTTLKALHAQRELKSRLCLDAPAVARELSKDPVCDIPDGDALIKILLDSRHSSRKSIPSILLHSTEAMIEDQQALEQQTVEAIALATNSLAPEQVELAYAQQPQPESGLQQANLKFRNKLSPAAQRWAFYEKYWPRANDRIRDDIHKAFEKRILQLTARRAKR
nr:FHA domain-containing protein [Oceanobacter mangrovi]